MGKKKIALITGASGGIGYELSLIMAKENFDLVLVARSTEKLKDLKSKIESDLKVRVTVVTKDLSEISAPLELFNELKEKNITITHLINNAGVGELSPFEDSSWEKLSTMIDLNIRALTYLTHLFLPQIQKADEGHIMNVSSIAAFLPGPNMAVYYASKAYVQSFSEAIAEELSGSNVAVTALCPGPTKSGFQEKASISEDSPMFKNGPSSKDVAEYAFQLIQSKSRLGVHGFKNKAAVFSLKFIPRQLMTKMLKKMQSKRTRSKS